MPAPQTSRCQYRGKETTYDYDVVLCIDKSTSSSKATDLAAQIGNLITALKAKDKINVKLGVIIFARTPIVVQELTNINSVNMETIKAELNKSYSGTNTNGGLMAAKKLFIEDTDVPDSNKYLLFASDGINYCWTDPENANNVETSFYVMGDADEFSNIKNYGNSSTSSLEMHINKGAYSGNTPTLEQVMDNTSAYNKSKTYWHLWSEYNGANAKNSDCIPSIEMATTMSSVEVGAYLTTLEFKELASKYNTVTMYWTQNGSKPEYSLGAEMMKYFASLGKGYDITGTAATGSEQAFEDIKNSIIFAVDVGSVITDTIGSDFDLTSTDSIELTVGDVNISRDKATDGTDSNTISFGGSKYAVKYTKDATTGKEVITVQINTPVENAKPLEISYNLTLNKSTTAGSYTVYTNESAYLTPVDSTKTTYIDVEFPVPTVNYTVPAPIIIIPPTSTEDIPDPEVPKADLPSDLNSVDHFKYIVGYPDGTVQPNGNISRAEVTTAFYRLLTAEKRDAVFTAANTFTDVKSTQWFNKAVSSMANGSYVLGYPDGSFGGSRNITRAEFVAIASRFMNAKDGAVTFSDVSSVNWAYQYISTAVAYGWIDGYPDGTFRPSQPITRAEAMTIINRMLNRGVDADGVIDGIVAWPDNAAGAWYYYDVVEATNDHLYDGSRPSEKWSSLQTDYSYDIVKYEHP